MNHIQLEIIANPFQQEELIALLDDYNPSGFEQTDETLKAYFTEDDFGQADIKKIVEGYDYKQTLVEAQNWNALWEQNFQPVVVGGFCAVRAHFHQPVKDVRHEIIITPKMSFGTGHHATTYLMMQHMEYLDFRNKSVFDFGTGTGILAILAEKLGASNVAAIDVDEWSIENTAENAERNGCKKIQVTLTSNLPAEVYDVVLANINRNVILDYLERLVQNIRAGGHVLLSGLLASDEPAVAAEAERCGLQQANRAERSGWILLHYVNPS